MFIINFIVYTVLDYLIQLFLDLGFGIELPKYHSYLAFMNGEAYLGDGAVFALLGCAFFYYFMNLFPLTNYYSLEEREIL